MELKAKDLRIGNYVFAKEKEDVVFSLGGYGKEIVTDNYICDVEKVKPIPLTGEELTIK